MNLKPLATRLSRAWLALLIAGAWSLGTPLRADCVVVTGSGNTYLIRCGLGSCTASNGRGITVPISPESARALCDG